MTPPARRLVVGVTGLPCAGKSHVAALLASGAVTGEAAETIDADRLGHEVLRRAEVIEQLVDRYGKTVLDAEGRVVRSEVARIVFADPAELAWLESVSHPQIAAMAEKIIAAPGPRLVVLEAALLLAAGMDGLCDLVLLVVAPRDVRLARAARRGWDEREVAQREQRLLPLFTEERLAACPAEVIIINNDAPDGDLREQLRNALSVVPEGKE